MPPQPPVPPKTLWRSAHRDLQAWVDSAHFAIDLLSNQMGQDHLGGIELLDVGCGTKLSRTLVDEGLPIGRYVGVDVSAETVGWLRANIHDPRFEYHHLDAFNALYNPSGTPLSEFERLLPDPAQFDLISLFSVFTHLDPDDYVTMLRLLRPCVKPGGRLLFSVFLDEDLDQIAVDRWLQEQLSSDDPECAERVKAGIARTMLAGHDPRYTDAIPDQPLMQARYTRSYGLELIEGTGWEVASVNDPIMPYIQHFIVCTPA